MADLSHLSNLQSTAPLDLPIYRETQVKPFPEKGRYTARVRESFPQDAFTPSQAGFLQIGVDPTIVGGTYDGYTIKARLSTKNWTNKEGKEESMVGRFLKACGQNDVIGGDPQAQANAVERTAGTLVTILVDWSASFGGRNGFKLVGMENFPKVDGKPSRFVTLDGGTLPNGTKLPEAKDPITGEYVVIRAFCDIDRFYPATN